MIKDFNDSVILTTQNPEAFLNYGYETSTYYIIPDANISYGTLLINGLDISTYDASTTTSAQSKVLECSSTNFIASFHVYTRCVSDFNASLSFLIYNDALCTSLYRIDSVNIFNRPNIIESKYINSYENQNALVDEETSYLILRTTPQFTGNIKLVVDSSNNMFLDTFKVSSELSNRKYRKQIISGNSIFSNDIKNVFGVIPVGEDLYKNDKENTLNISTPKTELFDQYRNTYSYGARLLVDEYYKEDNGILAPIWINTKLPDYFSVFRLPGVYNSETYDVSSLLYLASKYLEESDIIKSWSFKTDTPLGTYLNTHINDIKKYPGPLFLSLTDPSIANSESDPNTWNGISVNKGVITEKAETPYVFNKNIYNLTNLNAFVSQGFMRNKLISSNLINFEFLFDDNDASLYTMNRYFGLYLTENILYKIAYYSDVSGGNIRILSLDGNDSSIFINSKIIFNSSTGNLQTTFKNRIFILNDEVNLNRILNNSELKITSENIKSYVSKPYKNIFDVEVDKKDYNPFIILQLNKKLNPGEHLRIINKTQNKIWEIYGINSSMNCQSYVSKYSTKGYPTIYQTTFSTEGDISDQVESIEDAFDRFNNYDYGIFRSGIRGNNWVSIILSDDSSISQNWGFQRITSQVLNDINNSSSGFNTSASVDDITYFGRFTPSSSEYNIISFDASYGPINFEFYGSRMSFEIPLFNRRNNHLYSFLNTNNITNNFETYVLYQDPSYWYRMILNFDVSLGKTYQYIQDPLSLTTKYLIQTEKEIKTIGNRFNAYSIFPLNISLMGINPVKDLDYTVYDSSLGFTSEYFYNRENDVSTYELYIAKNDSKTISLRNSYEIKSGTGFISIAGTTLTYNATFKFNTFNSPANLIATSNTIVTYNILDGSTSFSSYKTNTSEENINDYYKSKKLLNYSLTAPSIFKWAGIGTDIRNNQLRLILDNSILSPGFFPVAATDSQESTYPVFKYLTTGERNWEDYVFYDINDTVQYSENNIIYYKTVKELMFAKPYVDVFSKLVYSNNPEIENIKNRATLLYYNAYKNSIDTIFLGLNLSFKGNIVSKDNIDIKNYDHYRFSLISTSSKNRDSKYPIEVIINENTKTMLMIWYQGNDVLNYTYRNSTYLPGKSLLDASDGYNINFRSFITASNKDVYSFVKTPFIVNNSILSKRLINIYDYKNSYDSSLSFNYSQLNYNLNDYSSSWTAFSPLNYISSNIFYAPYSYNTFSQYVSYIYTKNANTYGDNVVNYGYRYSSNDNLYTNNTCRISTLINLLEADYVKFWILKDSTILSNANFSSSPITISINSPKTFNNIKTYNGWYKPKFDNILEFKVNENSDLINIVKQDFTLCNTNLRTYRNLDQVWYNKVVSSVNSTDVSEGKSISYVSNFNIFKSLWDSDYFIKRNESLIEENIDGYECSKELPAYFGSKLPKLPDEIILNSWNNSNASYTTDDLYYILSFNITKAAVNLFNSNITFLSNWNNLSNNGEIINKYIEDTVLNYYYISKDKIQIDFYYKLFDSQIINYNYDLNFIKDNNQNLISDLYLENDEYIYKVKVPKSNNYTYFVTIKLIEK